MRCYPPRALRALLPLAAAAGMHAAISVDIDLARVRQAPDAQQVRQRLDALLPPAATAKLAALDALFGFDPRRDLTRVLIDVPDEGGGLVRLVGLPAKRIALALSLRGGGVAL